MANAMHGDLHERILKISKEIKKNPDSANLYFKRSKLYFQHEDYKKSLKDLIKSSSLGFNTIEQQLHFSRTYLKLKDYKVSIEYAQKILEKKANHVMAIKLIAENLYQLGDFEAAAMAYEEVINYSKDKLPENYVDTSVAWESLSNRKGYLNAEKIIKKGIKDLGNIISLYNRLRELALNQADYSKAISVQNEIIELVPRKEFSYYKLYELHQLNNDETSALHSLTQSKICINKLPQRSQNTSFIKELKKNIKKAEEQLSQRN